MILSFIQELIFIFKGSQISVKFHDCGWGLLMTKLSCNKLIRFEDFSKNVYNGPPRTPVYANYIGPSVMTDANREGFPICDDRITENDRCVIKIIGIHWDPCIYFAIKVIHYIYCKFYQAYVLHKHILPSAQSVRIIICFVVLLCCSHVKGKSILLSLQCFLSV